MVFTHCRQTGERLWIGITKSFDLNCGSVLSSFSSQTRNNYFEAFAENVSLTQSGILVQANVTSWSAPTGGTLRSLASGTYKMCAFIEASNGDGRLGNGEPMSDSFFRVGGESPQLVNDWTSY